MIADANRLRVEDAAAGADENPPAEHQGSFRAQVTAVEKSVATDHQARTGEGHDLYRCQIAAQPAALPHDHFGAGTEIEANTGPTPFRNSPGSDLQDRAFRQRELCPREVAAGPGIDVETGIPTIEAERMLRRMIRSPGITRMRKRRILPES